MRRFIRWRFRLLRILLAGESTGNNYRLAFSNIVFIILPIVYFAFILIDLPNFIKPLDQLRFDQFIVPIEILVCWSCLYLNRKGATDTSRTIFLITWPFLMHIIPIWLLDTPPDYYFAFPAGMIFHSVLVQIMISRRYEAALYWTLMAYSLLITTLAVELLVYFDPVQEQFPGLSNERYFFLDIVLYWLLFNLLGYYLILSIEKYLENLNKSRDVIKSQKLQLDKLARDQEVTISIRTKALEETNIRLRNHAFYNAHLLRGPFCRIQGLIQLEDIITTAEEKAEIRIKLNESVQELSDRIREIQQIVDEGSDTN